MTERQESGLPEVPGLRLARGRVTDEEAAAVVTVLVARLRQEAAAAPARGPARAAASGWCDRASLVGGPVTPGPDGWRKSALPGF